MQKKAGAEDEPGEICNKPVVSVKNAADSGGKGAFYPR